MKADKTAAIAVSFNISVDQTGTAYQPGSVNGVPPGTHYIYIMSDDTLQDPASNLSSATGGVTLGASWTSLSSGSVWRTSIVITATSGTFNISGNVYNTSNIATAVNQDFTIDSITLSYAVFPATPDPVGGNSYIQTRLKNNDKFDSINIGMSTTGFTSVTIDGVVLEQDANDDSK